jgi:glycoprotein-N-acetylgalactosamine 3-beta-galactosyltransferase
MTQPENHLKKAVHVKATWAKRCNVALFMSTSDGTGILIAVEAVCHRQTR